MLTYTVNEGDTLWQISRRFGVTLDSLVHMNPQIYDPNYILPGSEIYIPEKTHEEPPPPVRNSRPPQPPPYTAPREGFPPAGANREPRTIPQPDSPPYIYQAQHGETLGSIANKLNLDPNHLAKMNLHLTPQVPLTNRDTVFVPVLPNVNEQPRNRNMPGNNPSAAAPAYPAGHNGRRRKPFAGNRMPREKMPPPENQVCPYCGRRLPPT